jgi:sugar phosphate isomerase/epimerase
MHDRLSVHSVCFRDAGLRELAGHWRSLGVRRVSLYNGLLETEGLAAAQAALASGDCCLETITHNFLPYGQQVDAQDVSWERAQEKLIRLIADAKTLGAQSIQLFTGGHGALTWEDAAERISTALSPCVAQARTAGVALIIENAPPVYAAMHLAHSLRDTVTLAELAGVGVCIDVFSCWTEAGLEQTIERAIARTSLVQLGDYVLGDTTSPGRAVPGDGNIPLGRIIDWILRAGYRGTFEIEVLGPRIDAEGRVQATQRASRFLTETLSALGA